MPICWPRLTLLPWEKYNINNNIKLKNQEDYIREDNEEEDFENEEEIEEERQCYDRRDDEDMEE